MKIIGWLVGGIFAILVGLFALQYAASERVEVVVLHSTGESGEVTTRLWVADYEDAAYLRASPDSGWYQRLIAHPEIQVLRNGKLRDYQAVPRPELRDAINAQMAAKYTWSDTLIDLLIGGREDAIPVELQAR